MAEVVIGSMRFNPLHRRRGARSLWLQSFALGPMLALLVILGIVTLSGWHGRIVNMDDLPRATFVEHDDEARGQADLDGTAHLAAHAAGEGVLATAEAAEAPGVAATMLPWPDGETALNKGIDPGGLLRPPRH